MKSLTCFLGCLIICFTVLASVSFGDTSLGYGVGISPQTYTATVESDGSFVYLSFPITNTSFNNDYNSLCNLLGYNSKQDINDVGAHVTLAEGNDYTSNADFWDNQVGQTCKITITTEFLQYDTYRKTWYVLNVQSNDPLIAYYLQQFPNDIDLQNLHMSVAYNYNR